jgi:putative multiple sugar transport system permease protein
MENIARLFRDNIRQYGMVLALLFIVGFFQILTGGILLNPLNVTNIILQNSYILILAIGMLLVIVAFQIDLSVGSLAAFVGAVSGVLMVTQHMPFWLSMIVILAFGALLGAWHGFWIAYVRIPAFIVTLSGMLLFRGLTYVTLQGQSIGPFPTEFQLIASGFLPDVFGGQGIHITTLVLSLLASATFIWSEFSKRAALKKYGFAPLSLGLTITKLVLILSALNAFALALAAYKGIPNVLVLLIVLILLYTFIANKTIPGRHIYALGGNEKAAALSGVKTKRVLFWVFVNMGVLAALSGMVFAARLNAATPKAGTGFELDAIAACFIGGASTAGGIGTIMGAMIGALVMGVLNNGMSLLGVGIDWQQAIKGMVLLLAVTFDVFSKSKS